MRHFIYSYNGEIYSRSKKWSFQRIEQVLTRLGADYWEIETLNSDVIWK